MAVRTREKVADEVERTHSEELVKVADEVERTHYEEPVTEESAEETDPWGEMLDTVQFVPTFTRTATVDVDTIPTRIRRALDLAFSDYGQETTSADGRAVPAESPKWFQFDARTPEKAEEFIKLAKAYGKHRPAHEGGQMSVRAFRLSKTVNGERTASTVVKFTAMPLVKSETRNPSINLAHVRAWAKENGHSLKDRGRIPEITMQAYKAAHASLDG